jgi:hypothetical protein
MIMVYLWRVQLIFLLMLTDRVLLVHAPHEFDGLFCGPFPGSSWT